MPKYQNQFHSDSPSQKKQLLTSQTKFILALKHLNIFQPEEKYKVICPFHSDVNASMLVDIPNQRFYCFGCGASGTTIDLLKNAHPNENIFTLYKYIYNNIIYNIDKFAFVNTQNKKQKKKNINKTRDYYYNLPNTNWYKLTDVDDLEIKQYLKYRGFRMHTLVSSGAKISYNQNYPVVFPMFDNGIFRGYVCRTTNPEIEKTRKYLYNEGFSRASTLAGEYRDKTVLIVEGYMDMLKAKQFGIKNVVAILGWKISAQQVEKLKRKGVNKILCGLDNDECGRKGYKYLKQLNQFTVVRIHYPSSCKDFGDITSKTSQRVLNQIKNNGGQ